MIAQALLTIGFFVVVLIAAAYPLAIFVTRIADRLLNPLIGKSLVLYLAKPLRSADLSDAKSNLPRGVPGRRGPTTPSQGAAA